jgi:hypothetical protein
MGEHVGNEVFRVVDISVQWSGGSQICFIRNPGNHQSQLRDFFERTGADYSRFNYLGEWHSHPSFDPLPSAVDNETMQSIVEDPTVGANFLVLLIPRLSNDKSIEASATAFRAGAPPISVPVSVEVGHKNQFEGIVHRLLRKMFRL